MKGTFFLGGGEFETRTMASHDLADNEVLVKVSACGVCGTDVHIFHGDKGSAEVDPPVILGHEISGIVERIGNKVSRLKPGDHVALDPNIYCGECHYCRIGKKQLCMNLQAIGVTRNGGFADYCYAPESQCFLLSDEVPLDEGAMAEPLACCIHGMDRLGLKHGETVCVIGGGAIGLLMVQLSRLGGASTIILSEPVEERRRVGLSVGADYAIDPTSQDIGKEVRRILGKSGADCVIECVGNVKAIEQAFQVADKGAKLLLFSVPKAGSEYALILDDVYRKELTIVGSMINPDTHQRAVDLINSRKIELRKLITHHFPHEKLKEAIFMQMSCESLKVIVG